MNKQQPNETSQDNNLKDVEEDFEKVEDMVDRMVNGSGAGRIEYFFAFLKFDDSSNKSIFTPPSMREI